MDPEKIKDEQYATDVDEILEKSGPCGIFQIGLQILFMFFVLVFGYEVLITYFTGIKPSWSCTTNSTSEFCIKHINRTFDPNDPLFDQRCQLERNEWNYTTPIDQSFVSEFDLVCKQEIYVALTTGTFFIGAALGSALVGIIADRYGRRLVLITTLLLSVILSILTSFVTSPWQLLAVRTLLGSVHLSCYGMGFIYISEFLPAAFRTTVSSLYSLAYNTSNLILTAVAYYNRRWRSLQFYSALPAFVFLLFFYFLPKSPRWLVVSNKVSEAERVLRKIYRINRKESETCFIVKVPTYKTDTRYTYIDLFRHPTVALTTCVMSFLWMAIGLIYFTVILESSNLGGNIYESYALSTLSDIPSNFASAYLCQRFGRKKSTLGSILASFIFVGIIATIPNSLHAFEIRIALAMCGRFFAHCACNGIYVWTFEIFPTVIRTQGWMVCNVVFRLSGAAAPLLTTVLQSVSVYLPYGIICAMGLFSFCIGMLLPETLNSPTREKYEDMIGGYRHEKETVVDATIIANQNV